MEESIAGSSFGGPAPAPKGRRFAAGVIDLIIVPIVLGVLMGLLLLSVPEIVRNVILILVNIAWLIFRDAVYSPGRAMVGLKLVSLTGEKPTLAQAFIRNVLIIIPFALTTGYPCEMAKIFLNGSLIGRRIIYIILFLLVLVFFPGAFATKNAFAVLGVLAAFIIPVIFLVIDRTNLSESARLMDRWAKTRVVSA